MNPKPLWPRLVDVGELAELMYSACGQGRRLPYGVPGYFGLKTLGLGWWLATLGLTPFVGMGKALFTTFPPSGTPSNFKGQDEP